MTTFDLVFADSHGREWPLVVVRPPRARRMRLSLDRHRRNVRLSLPPRSSLKAALGWVADKRQWVEAALAELPAPRPIENGMCFCLAGQDVIVEWVPTHPRTPCLADGVLRIGGTADLLGPRLQRFLKSEALSLLARETRALAERHGIAVGRIGIGDARTRWGSCSASGDIRYNWRLILAPNHVRQAIIAHEVAHRVHMNHGADFHCLARHLTDGDPAAATLWLKRHGGSLYSFGRSG